jgi:hypothetical protein
MGISAAAQKTMTESILDRGTANLRQTGARWRFTPATRFDWLTTTLSWILCSGVLIYFLSDSSHSEAGSCFHWFVIPVFFSGVLIAHDLIDWLRGRMELFDPVGFLGLWGFHWFFLAPLLHIHWNWWLEPKLFPADMRHWLGISALLNLVGLVIYRYLRNPFSGRVPSDRRTIWTLQPSRLMLILPFFLAVSLVMEILMYSGRGGILGMMEQYSSHLVIPEFGIATMFSECFPILAMMAFVLVARRVRWLASLPALAAAMLCFFVVLMIFGGLKGSRSPTMFQLFWAAGMIHFFLRPLSRKLVLVGLLAIISFTYVYAFYKIGGLRAIEALRSGESMQDVQQSTRHTLHDILLGDMGRADLQAFIISRLCDKGFEYDYALGRTYYATLCCFIPHFIWPNRPYLIMFEGTEIQYGKGSFDPVDFWSRHVYGAPSEAMLNFGVPAVPLVFLIGTFLVARVRRFILTCDAGDLRLLFAPFLVLLLVLGFISDTHNMFFTTIKFGAVPFFVIWAGTNHLRLRGSNHYQAVPRPIERGLLMAR